MTTTVVCERVCVSYYEGREGEQRQQQLKTQDQTKLHASCVKE